MSCKPVFLFILNQAVADFGLAIVVVVVVNLRYQPGADLHLQSVQRKCQLQMGIWLWIILISIVSTTMLTLDRFLYITTTLQYNSIVTSSRVIMALLACWILPAVHGLIFMLTFRSSGDIECIVSHAVPLNLIIVYIFLLLTVFLFVYISYSIILIKFCKRKRRLQKSLAQTRLTGGTRTGRGNISNGTSTPTRAVRGSPPTTSPTTSPTSQSLRRRLLTKLAISRQVLPGVSHLLKSMTAAKYILTTMTALSLTWLPWLITLSTDIYTHTAGQEDLSQLDQVEVAQAQSASVMLILVVRRQSWRSYSAVSMISSTVSGLARQAVSSVTSVNIPTNRISSTLFMLTIR